jgi:nitrogen fixation protein FixH
MTVKTVGEHPFTGWHMLAAVVGFFGVVVAVNIGMAIVASRSWTGLVVANSYVASQEFEEKRVAHEAQKDAGWISSLTYGDGSVRLVVTDASGARVELGGVSVLLNRPVGGHDDQTLDLLKTPDGTYEAPASLGKGIWEANVDAPSTPLGPFELHTRFRIAGEVQ